MHFVVRVNERYMRGVHCLTLRHGTISICAARAPVFGNGKIELKVPGLGQKKRGGDLGFVSGIPSFPDPDLALVLTLALILPLPLPLILTLYPHPYSNLTLTLASQPSPFGHSLFREAS